MEWQRSPDGFRRAHTHGTGQGEENAMRADGHGITTATTTY
ncbi:MAG: hypothetical protein ACYDER_22340 [Ktedonobacteraceae bacterium]